ncbi:hypothetical protein CLV59_101561 [Chitinophaga dinghuensis]|uniref:Uncharacterized protein n=1 Tax=Chitinophaga dinghuensis TaxID=1539050 RepID=A0A327WEL3_9BACT|nr:hypothetical protein [Chitinophaga dinghuensis]RAJ87800.1 hypothetical protein CLV59_101561 [Chitinophaga dinghuensis]
MNFHYQVEQVAYWIDQGESVISIKKDNLVKELTEDEIDQVAVAYRQHKQQFKPKSKHQSALPLVYGIGFILIGLFRIVASAPAWIGWLCVFIGAIRIVAYFVMLNESEKDEENMDYNISKTHMLEKLADDLQAAREQAATTA